MGVPTGSMSDRGTFAELPLASIVPPSLTETCVVTIPRGCPASSGGVASVWIDATALSPQPMFVQLNPR
jgi:hypothetical protein